MKTKLRHRYEQEKAKYNILIRINRQLLPFFIDYELFNGITDEFNNDNSYEIVKSLWLDHQIKYKITIYEDSTFVIYYPSSVIPKPVNAFKTKIITEYTLLLSLNEIRYKKKYFKELENCLEVLIDKKNMLSEKTIYNCQLTLLKLSKYIPFNSYDYCLNIITDEYYLYKYKEMLEYKEKLISYIINKINNSIQQVAPKSEKIIYNPVKSIDELIKIREQELYEIRSSNEQK